MQLLVSSFLSNGLPPAHLDPIFICLFLKNSADKRMFSLVDTLQTYSCRYICLASSSMLFPFLLFFRKKFGFFFFRKRVKFSAISPGLPKRTQLTQPRYHGFSAAFPLAEMTCTINASFSLHNSGECNLDEK